jgi:hypothetical protein
VAQELEKALPPISLVLSDIGQNAALLQAVEQLQQAFERREWQQRQREYSQLFTSREQCRLNEVDYEKAAAAMSQRLADISAFYWHLDFRWHRGQGSAWTS